MLMGLTALVLASLVLIAEASSFRMLMVARGLLGVALGGFCSLATATVMRLVPEPFVPTARAALLPARPAGLPRRREPWLTWL
jgi:predicted MFS family arabinose efflux permease